MRLFFEITLKGIYSFITNSNYREYLKLAFLYGGKKRYRKTTIKFLKFEIEIPDCRSFIPQFKDIFLEENYKFISESDSPVILDCGANIGTSCLYFSQQYPKAQIIAFEADPKITSLLESNLERNNINNVEIHNKAVWINNDGVDLSIEGADGSSIFTEGKKIKVDSIRLKELIQREETVDMLKIDVEGAEIEIIKDCEEVLSKVCNIFIEYHSFLSNPQNLSSILKILENNNFRYFVKNEMKRKLPFVNKNKVNDLVMDLQINIYAYRVNR